MLLMRGFSRLEDVLLDVAGVFGPCVGLFPMTWRNQAGWNPHQFFAVSFFVCIGLTAIFCSTKTLDQMPGSGVEHEKKVAFYRRWYRFWGILMVALPVCAEVFFSHQPIKTFMVEAAGVWAFGLYWIFKTFELKDSDVEAKLIRGHVNTLRKTLHWVDPTPGTTASSRQYGAGSGVTPAVPPWALDSDLRE
jgi:hypothetical membrane protein